MEHARQTFPDLWKGRTEFAPSKGRVIDHISFSVENLQQARDALKGKGINVDRDGFVEGPDHIRIELVQSGTALNPR
jgi:hypothetical protein